MKGRAQRAEAHDDWVDDSWTVDCVCGVNFDDGDEMVKCDECGVWVHTRCSRYTKGEELFACDKCKAKANRLNDSEETEVAQLLVELPTKTVRMESAFVAQVPPRRPFRLWTDIPMEERVHVQGAPGGDPRLFAGLSGVFSPELWKCTGYVPKKFNFRYREFPCWDEDKKENEIENLVDNGAGMLFSLSKERALGAPLYWKKEGKKSDSEDGDGKRFGAKKEKSLLQPFVVFSNKRKKEDAGAAKDRSGKKKARTAAEREADEKKRIAHTSRAVFRPTSDAKPLDFYEDRGPKFCKNDDQGVRNKNQKDNAEQEPISDDNLALHSTTEKPTNNVVVNGCPSDALPSERPQNNLAIKDDLKEDKVSQHSLMMTKSSPETVDVVAASLESLSAVRVDVKGEGDNTTIDGLDGCVKLSTGSAQIHPVEVISNTLLDAKSSHLLKDSNTCMNESSVEAKMEVHNKNFRSFSEVSSSPSDAKDPAMSEHYISRKSKNNDAVKGNLQSCDHKAPIIDKTSQTINVVYTDRVDGSSSDPAQCKQYLEGSESSVPVQNTSECKQVSRLSEDQSKLCGNVDSEVACNQQKVVVCVGKSSSTSASVVHISSSASNSRPANAQSSNANTKPQVISESGASMRKDVREEDRNEFSQKMKEYVRSPVSSSSKLSHPSRMSHASASKKTTPESKDSVPSSSSKASSVHINSATSASGESAKLLQNNNSAQIPQSRASASGLAQKSEKSNQSNCQLTSKVSHASSAHPPVVSNSPSTLSDEELALLLHQELNSSPRVPRVPRVRHAGSLPQLASPTATSMLIKRASSFGGKEHVSASRRKSKDVGKDGARNSCELDDETKRTEKVPSSPDQKRQDVGYVVDASARREDKNAPPASSTMTNSGPSSSTEVNDQNPSSTRNSPSNISDDDAGTARGSAPRTLPGLINEIMSKGRRMTCEELCNAVLPHWPNLRKHNGERYAYSSHSQAVLDCLRNRPEWVRLVARGPKTNSSRKKRKVDAEESDDNEYSKGNTTKDMEGKNLESQREEFPKGKRKARKRRRLALQGRGIKDVQRRRRADLTDDDMGPFSNSSEDSIYSEDEIQGGPAGNEASASTDEIGTM